VHEDHQPVLRRLVDCDVELLQEGGVAQRTRTTKSNVLAFVLGPLEAEHRRLLVAADDMVRWNRDIGNTERQLAAITAKAAIFFSGARGCEEQLDRTRLRSVFIRRAKAATEHGAERGQRKQGAAA
jgi:hypothetical protein